MLESIMRRTRRGVYSRADGLNSLFRPEKQVVSAGDTACFCRENNAKQILLCLVILFFISILLDCELLKIAAVGCMDDVDAADRNICIDGLARLDSEAGDGESTYVDDAYVGLATER